MEEEARDYPITKNVLKWLPDRHIVDIRHYKDIFNRPGQEFLIQKQSPKLILARRRDNFLYEGAPMCERYGHDRFYYATLMMNCLYNCAYCYLQTVYPSGNIVAFVNPEDYFTVVTDILISGPAYISISYDADIMAFEKNFGYVKIWSEFARGQRSLTLEVRTKSANFSEIADISPVDNMILAWTVSPQSVIESYEENAPSLSARLANIKAALHKGWNVRICLDPILPLTGWVAETEKMIQQLSADINIKDLYDISVNTFRMSSAQYKKLRRMRPQFPELLPGSSGDEIAIVRRILDTYGGELI